MTDKQDQTGKLAEMNSLTQQLMQRAGNVPATKTKEAFTPIIKGQKPVRLWQSYRLLFITY